MISTAEQIRAWRGPAVLSFGFRPFFLMAGIWSALAMALWIAILGGWTEMPTRFDPVAWHAHEMLFGYLGAVIAGFLLTAVPNWTGRMPVVGWPLAALSALWLLGRAAIAYSQSLPAVVVALVDLSFIAVIMVALGREITVGRNWRNLPVLAMLGLFLLGNLIFHLEDASGTAASGYGIRLGVAVAVMLISLIGGRIVPSFTRNWLVKRGSGARPEAFGSFDRITLAMTTGTLMLWVSAPGNPATGVLFLLAGVFQTLRLLRWSGLQTAAEPLVWILHAGYAFVPLGALVLGLAILTEDPMLIAAAQHLWMAGAIGVMTLAVMTRATLGHTGRSLTANSGTATIYVALIGSVLVRLAVGIFPASTMQLYSVSGALWIVAFGGFVLLYGPALVYPRLGT